MNIFRLNEFDSKCQLMFLNYFPLYHSYFVTLFYWPSLLLPFVEEFIPLEFVIVMCGTPVDHRRKNTRPDDFIGYVSHIILMNSSPSSTHTSNSIIHTCVYEGKSERK